MAEVSVTVYTTPTCPWCVRAKSYLDSRGVPYVEKDVSKDMEAARELVKVSGQMGVPVILINDNTVIGFNQKNVELLLDLAEGKK